MAPNHPGHGRHSPRRASGRQAALRLACAIAVWLAAGCGTSTTAGTPTTSTATTQLVAFSECMRAHGVSAFPDPGAAATGAESSIGGIPIPNSIDTGSPAFATAQIACQTLLSARLSRQGKPSIGAGQKTSLIARSQCMRSHGIADYPDPAFPPGGGISITFGPGINPQSPIYKRAEAACASS